MGLVQTSSEATGSWSLSPPIVIRDSFRLLTRARFQMGEAQPTLTDVKRYRYFWYIIHITIYVCVLHLYDFSNLVGCSSSVSIRRSLQILKYTSFWLHSFYGQWDVLVPVKRFNHKRLMGGIIPTDRPKLIRNRCVIEVFVGVFCVVNCFFKICC